MSNLTYILVKQFPTIQRSASNFHPPKKHQKLPSLQSQGHLDNPNLWFIIPYTLSTPHLLNNNGCYQIRTYLHNNATNSSCLSIYKLHSTALPVKPQHYLLENISLSLFPSHLIRLYIFINPPFTTELSSNIIYLTIVLYIYMLLLKHFYRTTLSFDLCWEGFYLPLTNCWDVPLNSFLLTFLFGTRSWFTSFKDLCIYNSIYLFLNARWNKHSRHEERKERERERPLKE